MPRGSSVVALWAVFACAFIGAACMATSSASAQRRTPSNDAQARSYFERGRVAYDDERYEEALAAFQQAYSLSERAALLYNIGQCADRIGRRDLAIDAFQRYLDAVPDASNRVEVATRLELLREHVERPTSPAEDATHGTRPVLPDPEEQGGGSVVTQAWFWVLVGCLVVVGVGVAIGVAVASAPNDTAQPPTGDVGVGGIVFALGGP